MHPPDDVSSLRDTEDKAPPEPTVQWNARIPASVAKQIKEEAMASGRTQALVIIDAFTLEQGISDRLTGHRSELKGWASANGLSLSENLADVLARLVLRGLECDKKPKK